MARKALANDTQGIASFDATDCTQITISTWINWISSGPADLGTGIYVASNLIMYLGWKLYGFTGPGPTYYTKIAISNSQEEARDRLRAIGVLPPKEEPGPVIR